MKARQEKNPDKLVRNWMSIKLKKICASGIERQ